jgi:regulatory protein
MTANDDPVCAKRRAPKPLDAVRLEEMALAYVARFATSAAKLEAYLVRKLRERGWTGERPPDPSAIAARFIDLGYIDDEAFARSRSSSLMRRGYGPRRVADALKQAGIAEDVRRGIGSGEAAARHAALTLARKRRLGPFGGGWTDRAGREKQVAAMLRAGHGLDKAAALVDAATIDQAEEWAAEHDAQED